MWVVRVISGGWFSRKTQHPPLIERESLVAAGFDKDRER
jgi:hypothetical protein